MEEIVIELGARGVQLFFLINRNNISPACLGGTMRYSTFGLPGVGNLSAFFLKSNQFFFYSFSADNLFYFFFQQNLICYYLFFLFLNEHSFIRGPGEK